MCEIYCAESWPLCVCRIIHAIVWENALCNLAGNMGSSLFLSHTHTDSYYDVILSSFPHSTWHGAVQVKQVSSFFILPFL